jgi:UDP-glucose 4-epimerase
LKIVITGASGFIGSHLIEHLSDIESIEVIPLSRKEIPNLIRVSDYGSAPTGDVLIHLAEDNNLKSVASQSLLYENKVLLTLEKLLAKNFKRTIYTSSSILYGDKSIAPHRTNDDVFINTPYSRIKRLAESAVLEHPSGMVIRIANVYGPRMPANNVMSQILNQISQQGDLEVGDMTPIRDFISVRDLVEGISKLALMDLAEVSKPKIYNLGSGVGTSVGDLALLTLELAGQAERRVVSKNLTRIASNIVLDNSETTSACGWIPRTSLRQGVENLLISKLRSKS